LTPCPQVRHDKDIRLRSKNSDLREERSGLKRQQENDKAESQTALKEQGSSITNLRSLLDRRNQELHGLKRSVTTTQEERTRLQIHSNEMTVSMLSFCQELEDARAVATAA
jgi:predicted RNase H-like nuclease (RuvC/YqgF family)